jgi:hypothetical protein
VVEFASVGEDMAQTKFYPFFTVLHGSWISIDSITYSGADQFLSAHQISKLNI